MYITLITDCADANARGRQTTRIRSTTGCSPSFVPVSGSLDRCASLEASGNIVDMLDAAGDGEGIVLANVAPRQGVERRWGNGTPFGFFRHQRSLVCTTVSGAMLSVPFKLGLFERYFVLDMHQTLLRMAHEGVISSEDVERISASQFRSFDFLPLAAWWIYQGGDPVTHEYPTTDIPETHGEVWCMDNFGNMKTTILAEELPLVHGHVSTRYGELPFVRSLKDVPDGTAAITVGSSGIGERRFVEIVVQGGHAAERFGVRAGDRVFDR